MYDRKVAVIGLGYIGLPTSAVLAHHGVRVHGVDVNQHTVDEINAGRVPIVEPDLDTFVRDGVQKGLITAHTDVPDADVFMIAVPTPFFDEEGRTKQPDLTYVEQASRTLAAKLTPGAVVILESTSPPGTTRRISEWIAEERPDLKLPHQHPDDPDVFLAHCPERVLPGRIMVELVTNDRLVGGLTPACAEKAAELYRVFCEGDVIITDATSAEMAKLVENSFRDVNIAFANELAAICEHLDLDVWEVIALANKHPRVNVLNPGPGVGGHCIAVDPWFIVAAAPEQARLIRTAREVNDARPQAVVDKTLALAAPGATIACLGLAFKADIDDLRESPAITVTRAVAEQRPDTTVLAVEPHVEKLPDSLGDLANLSYAGLDDALERADVVLLLVDHAVFKEITLGRLDGKAVVDTRGIWR